VGSTGSDRSLGRCEGDVPGDSVVLNKGPYVHKAVATLDDLLRMQGHHQKKRHLMRKLNVAGLPIHEVSFEAAAP
jgi:hypothetical protein